MCGTGSTGQLWMDMVCSEMFTTSETDSLIFTGKSNLHTSLLKIIYPTASWIRFVSGWAGNPLRHVAPLTCSHWCYKPMEKTHSGLRSQKKSSQKWNFHTQSEWSSYTTYTEPPKIASYEATNDYEWIQSLLLSLCRLYHFKHNTHTLTHTWHNTKDSLHAESEVINQLSIPHVEWVLCDQYKSS